MHEHCARAAAGGVRTRPSGAIRVLYLIDSLGWGGAERVLIEVTRQLLARGVDVHVVALQSRNGNPAALALQTLGVHVPVLNIERLRYPIGYRRIRQVIADIAPDVVHTHLEFSNVLGTLAAHRLGVPSVATLHSIDSPPVTSRAYLRSQVAAYVLRTYASRVYAVSESARSHHLRAWRLRQASTVVLNNGVDLARFRPRDARVRRTIRTELAIPHDARVIVTTAVQRVDKGIDRMIAALPAVLLRHPSATYVLAGDGPARRELEARACELGLGNAVRFVGMRSDVDRILAGADLFVLPSLTDALPTAVAEAMAAGLPMVCSRVGGLAEMIEHGRSGLLVRPGNVDDLAVSVVALLDAPETAAAMGRAAREIAERRFGSDRFVERLEADYRDLVSHQPVRSN